MTPESPTDPPMQSTRLRGGRFAWCSSGSGPTVVAVHGAPGSGRDFRWLASAVPGVRLVRLDMPGYGRSDWASGPGYSLAARARFVLEATEALGLRRFTALGHSQGGGVVTAAAVLAPDRVERLALVASIGRRAVHDDNRHVRGRRLRGDRLQRRADHRRGRLVLLADDEQVARACPS